MTIMPRLIAFMMACLLMQNMIATAEMSNPETLLSADNVWLKPPVYSSWKPRPARMDVVPPPPSGPYLSTGLSDKQQGHQLMYPPLHRAMPPAEWRRPPQQWPPESGPYRYAPANAVDAQGFMRRDPWQPYGNQRPQPIWQPMYQRPPQEYK